METIYAFSAYHGLFLSMVIFMSKYGKSISNRLIAFAIMFFSFTLVEWISYDDLAIDFPHLILLSNPFLYAIAPLIWLYVLSYTRWRARIPNTYIVIPVLVVALYLLGTYRFYLLSAEEKLQLLSTRNFGRYFYGPEEIYPLMYLILTMLFMILSLKEIAKSDSGAKVGMIRIKWVRVIIIAYLSFACIGFSGWVFNHYIFISEWSYHVVMTFQVIVIQGAGYLAIMNPSFFESYSVMTSTSKYTKSSLTENKIRKLGNEVINLLEKDKLYLQTEITPQDISDRLRINKHQLSQVLNQELGLKFNDLINKYRIEEAKEMILSENGKSLKIIHIAYDVGFNNKTTFTRNFKKYTSLTPSEFRSSMVGQQNESE